MSYSQDDKNIHAGHRQRMRAKLERHGERIFDTYELLEMLLYYVIPYRDTNPISKNLLTRFGTLDGVLSASREELLAVNGIGERAAQFISCVGELSEVIGCEPIFENSRQLDSYYKVGEFLVDYFAKEQDPCVIILLLDNACNLIAAEKLYSGNDYESSAIRPHLFIKAAAKHKASVVVTAHNHIYGPCCPSLGDMATDSIISQAIASLGVHYSDHFVVTGNQYVRLSRMKVPTLSHPQPLEEVDMPKSTARTEGAFERLWRENFSLLCRALEPVAKSGDTVDTLRRAMDKYRSIENILTADLLVLSADIGKSAALAVKLYSYLFSRRLTDLFKLGTQKSRLQVIDYFKALYIGVPIETVYVMLFDSKDRVIGCEYISDGTVNASEILPKKIIHTVLNYSAASVVISHNHPFGTAEPSNDDIDFTARVESALELSRVRLKYHVVVAGQNATLIGSGGALI